MLRILPLVAVLVLAGLPAPAGAGNAPSLLGLRPGMTVAAARETLSSRGGRFRPRGERGGLFRWEWQGRADLPGSPAVTVRLEATRGKDGAPVSRIVLVADRPGPVAREWRRALAGRWGKPAAALVDLRDPRSGDPVEGTVWRREGTTAVLVVAKEGTPRGVAVRRIALFLEPDFDPVALTRRRYREIRGR